MLSGPMLCNNSVAECASSQALCMCRSVFMHAQIFTFKFYHRRHAMHSMQHDLHVYLVGMFRLISLSLIDIKYSTLGYAIYILTFGHWWRLNNSLQPIGLYSPWNSPGQNTGGWSFPSPVDLPNSGIEPRSSALQADSLPAELSGKSLDCVHYPSNTYSSGMDII